MQELWTAIREWPIIIQGALGSGLFYFFLVGSQKLLERIAKYYSKQSKENRKAWLVSAMTKYEAVGSPDIASHTYGASMLIYRSLRYLYRSGMWLVLGLIFQNLDPIFGIVGFLGSLYYFIRGYNVVAPIDSTCDPNKKLEELKQEYDALDKPI